MRSMGPGQHARRTVAEVGEDELLAMVFPILAAAGESVDVTVGPGDDAAVLALGAGGLVATTDAVVHGRDWRDEWSTGADVGAKVAAQNVADVAAMGARPVALLVTLVMAPSTEVEWVARPGPWARLRGRTGGLPRGGRRPVLRAGGCADRLGDGARRSRRPPAGAPLRSSGRRRGRGGRFARAVRGRAAPPPDSAARPPTPRRWRCTAGRSHRYGLGPVAADAGATSMIDLSDGLLRDVSRVAAASGVGLDLHSAALAADVARLEPAVGAELARECVLGGGEEHSLVATFPADSVVPDGFRVIGAVRAGGGLTVDGIPQQPRGWDHFGG